jgi:serine protease inhibitor
MCKSAMILDLPEEFKANRPFLFVIHDAIHHGILFFGKYMKPE